MLVMANAWAPLERGAGGDFRDRASFFSLKFGVASLKVGVASRMSVAAADLCYGSCDDARPLLHLHGERLTFFTRSQDPSMTFGTNREFTGFSAVNFLTFHALACSSECQRLHC